MGRQPLSSHMGLECAHALRVRRGQAEPLEDFDPVPDCSCRLCVLLAMLARGVIDAGDVDVLLHMVLPVLAAVVPAERPAVAERLRRDWSLAGANLPSAPMLAELAGKLPNARQAPRPVIHDDDPLPIEAARGADILAVCEALGIKLRRVGTSWRGSCPLHTSESGNSFSVNPRKNVFHCFGCGAGGDVIDLHRRVTGVSFADAVVALAETGGAACHV